MTATDTPRPELTGVGGVPECLLSPTLLASLPENTSEAPWTVNCSAVLWTSRPTAAPRDALPPSLRDHRAAVVVGGMVRYLETPVGPYDEVFGIVMLRESRTRPFGHVAFMAAEAPPHLVGDRSHWALPKNAQTFGGRGGQRRP